MHDALCGEGSDEEMLFQIHTDTVTRKSMSMLQPRIWLNDEIINSYVSCLVDAQSLTGDIIF